MPDVLVILLLWNALLLEEKYFPRTMKNSTLWHEIFHNETLDQEEHFRTIFGLGKT